MAKENKYPMADFVPTGTTPTEDPLEHQLKMADENVKLWEQHEWNLKNNRAGLNMNVKPEDIPKNLADWIKKRDDLHQQLYKKPYSGE